MRPAPIRLRCLKDTNPDKCHEHDALDVVSVPNHRVPTEVEAGSPELLCRCGSLLYTLAPNEDEPWQQMRPAFIGRIRADRVQVGDRMPAPGSPESFLLLVDSITHQSSQPGGKLSIYLKANDVDTLMRIELFSQELVDVIRLPKGS